MDFLDIPTAFLPKNTAFLCFPTPIKKVRAAKDYRPERFGGFR